MEPFHLTSHLSCYRPQRSCGQGYVFTRVCDSVHSGGLQAERTPPGQGEPPPPTRQGEPPLGADPPSSPPHGAAPPTEQTPRAGRTPPPGQGEPPPGKHTPAYGQRAAGTRPTGMHSCSKGFFTITLRRSRVQ